MSFKTNRPPGPVSALSGFSLLGISGPDAATFLQAQTMNDVRALAPGHWHWNGWLNAKGRLIALFALLKLADDDFIVVLPDFPAEQLLPLLQRYVFRSKLRLQVIDDLVAAAQPSPPAADDGRHGDRIAGDRQSGLLLDFSGDELRRNLLLLPAGSELLAAPDADCDDEWLAADLAHGLPRLAASQSEAWTPQMLSLQRMHAFSLGKGCYPGQEIVARTHYLGQARRSMSRVGGTALEVAATITDAGGSAIGTVISVTRDGCNGLAVVQSDKAAQGALAGTRVVALSCFLEGLQRPV